MGSMISALDDKKIVAIIGVVIFLFVYKYSINIFDWIERQTYGTRTYVMETLEFLFIEISQDKVTYILLASSVGIGSFVFLLLGALVSWILGGILGFIVAMIGFKAPRFIIDFLVEE
jgi:tight adherence protein B